MSDFVYHKFSKGIYKRLGKSPRGEAWTQVLSREKETLDVLNCYLINIPSYFSARIKSDTAYHGLKGKHVVLEIENNSEKEDFFNLEEVDSGCLWFVEKEFKLFVPNEDIEFTTIQEYSPSRPCPLPQPDSRPDDTPPMPSLEELQKCSIHYEGRKTVLTYCDAFVGEAICHKDDEFKVESGIALAYSRAKEAKDEYDAKQEEKKRIKIGDTVRVVNNELFYPWYSAKVAEICQKINNFKVCSRYAYNKEYVSADALYTVHYLDKKFAYIEDSEDGLCYLFDVDGICKEEDNESKSVFEWDKEEEDDWDWLL